MLDDPRRVCVLSSVGSDYSVKNDLTSHLNPYTLKRPCTPASEGRDVYQSYRL